MIIQNSQTPQTHQTHQIAYNGPGVQQRFQLQTEPPEEIKAFHAQWKAGACLRLPGAWE